MSDPRVVEMLRHVGGALRSIDARIARIDTRQEQSLNTLGDLASTMSRLLDHYRELHVSLSTATDVSTVKISPEVQGTISSLQIEIQRLDRELKRMRPPNVPPRRDRVPPT